MTHCFDTNALLNLQEKIFDYEDIKISQQVLQELEDIKSSYRKDADVKYKARKVIQLLDSNNDKYDVIPTTNPLLFSFDMPQTGDNIICAAAKSCGDDTVLITDDISCRNIGRSVFGLRVESTAALSHSEDYKGFKVVQMNDEEMAYFYEHQNLNTYDLLINQYLIVTDSNNQMIDTRRWDGNSYRDLYRKTVKSLYFDKLKTKDIYQQCAIDSIMNNTITAISGKAGSGKTLLSLMGAMNLVENGKYDRIVSLFNPTKSRGAADLGFYCGSFLDKALLQSIGNILTTKFGDRYIVDSLIQAEKLKLVSMADCRGMEIKDNEILWITEAENTSIDLIRLCLSRVSSGAKIIVEGDFEYQTDSHFFDGENNGLKRVMNKLKGHSEFGCIQLQNVWRSKVAELCELL